MYWPHNVLQPNQKYINLKLCANSRKQRMVWRDVTSVQQHLPQILKKFKDEQWLIQKYR